MRIAFVNSSYQLGGAETVAQDLASGCSKLGHETRFYVAAGKTYPRDAGIVPLYPRLWSRLHHTRLHATVERLAPRFAWTDRRFRGLATGWPDLVHLHNFHGNYATVESLEFLAGRKPFVWTFHGHWGVTGGCDHPLSCDRYEDACGSCPRLGVWPLEAIDSTHEQLLLKVEHLGGLRLHVIAPSRLMADRIARSRVGRHWQVHHIPNGVPCNTFSGKRKGDADFRRALGLDPSATVVLVVNRDFRDPQKGFSTIRDALAACANPPVPIQVALVGQSSEWAASQLPPATGPLSLGYVGERNRLLALYEAADVFLFASPAETFPCVILEAMASACCVVATPTSGVIEQVEDGRTGFLAATMSGDDLAKVLLAVLGDASLRRRTGAVARDTATASYSADMMVRRHVALYEEIATDWAARETSST
jgi:glycosyltransferase involved in cell wall biosynthesis